MKTGQSFPDCSPLLASVVREGDSDSSFAAPGSPATEEKIGQTLTMERGLRGMSSAWEEGSITHVCADDYSQASGAHELRTDF